MRLQYDKRSAVRLASRIIPHAKLSGTITRTAEGNEPQVSETHNLKVTIGALKLAGRIILYKHGYNTPPLGAELGSRACPGVHTRDRLYSNSENKIT